MSTSWRPRPTPSSWRLPETLAAELAPALAARGTRVFDLSGAFRLRDVERSGGWYPHSPAASDSGVTYGLTEHYRAELPAAQPGRVRRLLSDRGDPRAAAARRGRPARTGRHHRREVRRLGRRKDADASGRISPSVHGSIAAYGVFAHRHAAEIEQELGMPVTFVPHLVPLDRGILETIYARLRPGVGARRGRRRR